MPSPVTRNGSCCVTLQLLKLVMEVTCTFDRMLMLFVRVEEVTCCSSFLPLTNRLETSRCGIAFHTADKKGKAKHHLQDVFCS